MQIALRRHRYEFSRPSSLGLIEFNATNRANKRTAVVFNCDSPQKQREIVKNQFTTHIRFGWNICWVISPDRQTSESTQEIRASPICLPFRFSGAMSNERQLTSKRSDAFVSSACRFEKRGSMGNWESQILYVRSKTRGRRRDEQFNTAVLPLASLLVCSVMANLASIFAEHELTPNVIPNAPAQVLNVSFLVYSFIEIERFRMSFNCSWIVDGFEIVLIFILHSWE